MNFTTANKEQQIMVFESLVNNCKEKGANNKMLSIYSINKSLNNKLPNSVIEAVLDTYIKLKYVRYYRNEKSIMYFGITSLGWLKWNEHLTKQPTIYPTTQPTIYPTTQLAIYPTTQPTIYPTTQPAIYPTTQPAIYPTTQPAIYPAEHPTIYPTTQPAIYPVEHPTIYPTTQPAIYPAEHPATQPDAHPNTTIEVVAEKNAEVIAKTKKSKSKKTKSA